MFSRINNFFVCVFVFLLFNHTAYGQATLFQDDFDTYTAGGQFACQNPVDWTTWSNLPCDPVEDAYISSTYSLSPPNSVVFVQNNDVVKPLGNLTSGKWEIRFSFYIPNGKAGFWNVLSGFTPDPYEWAFQVYFDVGGGARLDAGAASAATWAYTYDTWHTISVEIDLDGDMAILYQDGTLIYQWQYTLGSFGAGCANRIACVDFFGATANDEMYIDDYGFDENPVPNMDCFFTDDFSSGLDNWTITNDGGTCLWEIHQAQEYTLPGTASGNVMAADADACGSGTTLLSTATTGLDATLYQTVYLEFDNDWNAIDADDFGYVDVSTDNGSTWQNVLTFDATDVRNTHIVHDISSLVAMSTFDLRFVSVQPGWDWWWAIDNVSICGILSQVQYGDIEGTVSVNGVGLENVIVSLLDTEGFDDVYTDANGQYSFVDVPVGDYQVMIVAPLGYISDGNPKNATVIANQTTVVDFTLTEMVVMNNARGIGYWRHQFNFYLTGKGNAEETEQDLYEYIGLIHNRYTPLYPIYDNVNTFEEWKDILSASSNSTMVEKAKRHLSAILFNMVSMKLGQYTVVTEDQKTVGDVIDYVSTLILDGDETNDELAKDLAENVNNQQMIPAGIVPDGTSLFKIGTERKEQITYALFNNFPNPFNPNTIIKYQIPDAGLVTLKVYDVIGNEIAELVSENKEAGIYEVEFDASSLSSGIYFYQIKAGDFVQTKKMILMK
jgi:hypothetical protein